MSKWSSQNEKHIPGPISYTHSKSALMHVSFASCGLRVRSAARWKWSTLNTLLPLSVAAGYSFTM